MNVRTDVLVSSTKFINKSKNNFLIEHFTQSRINKNLISNRLFHFYKTNFVSSDQFYDIM